MTDPWSRAFAQLTHGQPEPKRQYFQPHPAGLFQTGGANFNVSRIMTPQINIQRRCKGFRPCFETYDGRTGAQLWPELWAVKA